MNVAATISDFMTTSPHTIGVGASLAVAREQMERYGIRHLPVLDGGVLVGIVTERDLTLVANLRGVDEKEVTLEDAMTPEPYSVRPDAKLVEVARAMAARKLGAAIVVEHGKVVGVFTTIDALRALADG